MLGGWQLGGILTLQDGGKPAYALLTGLTPQHAVLQVGGVSRWVLLASLAGLWRGEFATLWRTPPGYASRTADAEGGALRGWLEARLPQGQEAGGQPLAARITTFQLAQGLKPDGRAGPVTFMQLNRSAGIDEPRLLIER